MIDNKNREEYENTLYNNDKVSNKEEVLTLSITNLCVVV